MTRSPTHPPTDTGAIGAERSVLEGLLARVEAASGPDRDLDVDLSLATGHDPSMYGTASMNSGGKTVWSFGGGERLSEAVKRHPGSRLSAAIWFRVPAYTASLDAALALCDRVLGDVKVRVTKYRKGGARGEILADGENHDIADEQAATPALALVSAMLRALLAQAPSPATTPTGVLETSLIGEGISSVAESALTLKRSSTNPLQVDQGED